MRYASIRDLDISNGKDVGVALFTQGCPFHCYNCFNKETWDFNGGKEWDINIENYFVELAKKNYIKRVTILGGEPLIDNNLKDLELLLKRIKTETNCVVWIYTGSVWENLIKDDKYKNILNLTDILVDGLYDDSKKNILLKFKGSSNQRIIDVQKSLEKGRVVLSENN